MSYEYAEFKIGDIVEINNIYPIGRPDYEIGALGKIIDMTPIGVYVMLFNNTYEVVDVPYNFITKVEE